VVLFSLAAEGSDDRGIDLSADSRFNGSFRLSGGATEG
jgi:hypothetical protein